MNQDITFRFATQNDTALILSFIKKLAEYENMLDLVVASKSDIEEWLFEKKGAEVIFAVLDGTEIGFSLFFHNFSTFKGKSGIFIEDLFILPEHRAKGYGKAMFRQLSKIALERNCGMIEWRCLTWNDPAINFYTSLGAKPLSEWDTYQLSPGEMQILAGNQ